MGTHARRHVHFEYEQLAIHNTDTLKGRQLKCFQETDGDRESKRHNLE